MNLWLSLQKAISLWPSKEAIVDGEKRFTYAEFGKRVATLIHRLKELGLEQGARVAISSLNCSQYMEIYYACAAAGLVLVPLNYRLSCDELRDIIADSDAELIFFHRDFWKQALEILPQSEAIRHIVWIGEGHDRILEKIEGQQHDYESLHASPEPFSELPYLSANELAHLYYTSGTTGRPKGVMLSHGNVMVNALAVVAELGFNEEDTWIHAAPLFHLADAWSIFSLTWVGAKHVFLPHFQSSKALETISKEKITATVLVPTMLNAMLNDPELGKFKYDSLRLLITGGSPIAPETVRRAMQSFGCEYIQLYGMTETSPFLTISKPKAEHLVWDQERQLDIRSRTGRPYLGAEVLVVRSDGSQVNNDNKEVGEIIARGPTITSGYWKQPDATAAAIKNGWIHTGDLAVVDEYGYINIVDRKKDMIITGGENVFSTEVEHTLYEHPAVAECAVFGVPDERWGESVHAVVVRRPGFEELGEAELIEFVQEKLAKYKSPRAVEFMDELPKTGSGKIYKKLLREKYWSGRVKQVN